MSKFPYQPTISLTHVMVKKVLFKDQIFEMEILMNLHVKMSPEFENHIFSAWSVCVCVYVSVISITQNKLQQKHQIWYSTCVLYAEST